MSIPHMPWGKFVGQPLTEVETSYLAWVLEKANHPPSWLVAAIKAELARRFKTSSAPPPPPPPPRSFWGKSCPDPALATSIIATGFKNLARKHHPDVAGGDTETMKKLNLVAEWLKGQVPQ